MQDLKSKKLLWDLNIDGLKDRSEVKIKIINFLEYPEHSCFPGLACNLQKEKKNKTLLTFSSSSRSLHRNLLHIQQEFS
jgi:hypothetical protein